MLSPLATATVAPPDHAGGGRARPLVEAEFLAVDVETNGRGGDDCELTEVGAVLVGGGELHERFESLVRPAAALARGIQRFTGITQAMADAAPAPEDVLPAWRRCSAAACSWPTARPSTWAPCGGPSVGSISRGPSPRCCARSPCRGASPPGDPAQPRRGGGRGGGRP
ncbi:MAG: exonuclease domain-containing protein [Thermoleophilaceae bacterium]